MHRYILSILSRYTGVFLFLKSKEAREEIVHDVFVKVWENRQSLSDVQKLKPYLYRVAKNLLLDHLRRLTLRINR